MSTGFDINRVASVTISVGNRCAVIRRVALQLPQAQTHRSGATLMPGVTTIAETFSTGASSYHSLQATFERRFHNGLGFSAASTWAHLLDNAPNSLTVRSGNGVG